MPNFQGKDVTGPCFNYDAVVAAKLAVFNTPDFSSPLYFCHSLPFTMAIPIVNSIGPGCDSVHPCWAISQFTGAMEPEGPLLTELATNQVTGGTQIVGSKSAARAVYAFERYVTQADDAYPVAVGTAVTLLRVTQPQGGSVGYLRMSAAIQKTGFPGFYPAEIVSKLDAIASKTMWGIIGRAAAATNAPDAGSAAASVKCMLMYSDSNFVTGLPMLQMFSWGNSLYFSRGDAGASASGTHTALHGVTSTAYPAIPVKNIVYDALTMMLLPNLLPEFDAKAPDTGAANLQWSLHALKLSALSATAYAGEYCYTSCSGPTPKLGGSGVCAKLNTLFPSVAGDSGTCGVQGGDTGLQNTLAVVSLCAGAVEFIAIAVVLGALFIQKRKL